VTVSVHVLRVRGHPRWGPVDGAWHLAPAGSHSRDTGTAWLRAS
jgi:hypothetical protein